MESNDIQHILAGPAKIDKLRPDLLITETTYATTIRDSKRCRERDFLKQVHDCVEKGGKVTDITKEKKRKNVGVQFIRYFSWIWNHESLKIGVFCVLTFRFRCLFLCLRWVVPRSFVFYWRPIGSEWTSKFRFTFLQVRIVNHSRCFMWHIYWLNRCRCISVLIKGDEMR